MSLNGYPSVWHFLGRRAPSAGCLRPDGISGRCYDLTIRPAPRWPESFSDGQHMAGSARVGHDGGSLGDEGIRELADVLTNPVSRFSLAQTQEPSSWR